MVLHQKVRNEKMAVDETGDPFAWLRLRAMREWNKLLVALVNKHPNCKLFSDVSRGKHPKITIVDDFKENEG